VSGNLNPFTLLVAVVLSAQADDAGGQQGHAPALFEAPIRRRRMLALGEEKVRDYIRTWALPQQAKERHQAMEKLGSPSSAARCRHQ